MARAMSWSQQRMTVSVGTSGSAGRTRASTPEGSSVRNSSKALARVCSHSLARSADLPRATTHVDRPSVSPAVDRVRLRRAESGVRIGKRQPLSIVVVHFGVCGRSLEDTTIRDRRLPASQAAIGRARGDGSCSSRSVPAPPDTASVCEARDVSVS